MKLDIYISEVKRMAVSSEVNLDAKGLPVELLRDRGVKRMAVSSEVNLDAKGLPVELLRDRGEGMLKLRIDRCITTS